MGFCLGVRHDTATPSRANALPADETCALGTRALAMTSAQCTSCSPSAFLIKDLRTLFIFSTARREYFAFLPRVSALPALWVMPFRKRRTVVTCGGATCRFARLAEILLSISTGVSRCPANRRASSRSAGVSCSPMPCLNLKFQRISLEENCLKEETA